VRPPESVTAREKRASMAAYAATGPPGAYEYDHFVPLQLGLSVPPADASAAQARARDSSDPGRRNGSASNRRGRDLFTAAERYSLSSVTPDPALRKRPN